MEQRVTAEQHAEKLDTQASASTSLLFNIPCFDDFARSDSCNFFDLLAFQHYQQWTSPSAPSALSFRYQPLLVASYALFDPPQPLFTIVLCRLLSPTSLLQDRISGAEILALRPPPGTPQHIYSWPPPTTPPTSCNFQRSIRYKIRM